MIRFDYSSGRLTDPLASPFDFSDQDIGWKMVQAWLGRGRAIDLRAQCEAEFNEQRAIIVGASESRTYDPMLRETIVKAIPEFAARAAVESSQWLRRQFAELPLPPDADEEKADAIDTLVAQMVDSSDPDHIRQSARVFVARHLWAQGGFKSDADKARLDTESAAYNACWKVTSCARGVCQTNYECTCDDVGRPQPLQPHADAKDDTVHHRFDTQPQENTQMKSYDQHLRESGGDTAEATRRFHQEGFNVRERTGGAVRSDAHDGIVDVDAAERAMIARGREAWCQPIGVSLETPQQVYDNTARRLTQVRQAVQRADAQEVERKQHRTDAAGKECGGCGKELAADEAGDGTCLSCRSDAAERSMKQRNAQRSRAPFGLAAKMRGYDPDDAA